MCWYVRIHIKLKKDVLDAQGKATYKALLALGFHNVQDVRIGKLIELQIENNSRTEVEIQVKDMCQRLLANPVIEDYVYTIEEY
ncbi:MAG: phosphoribosylformylglycinamidine synthase subunit PurS [Atribacterota bacterium]|jgi:phosphoribosylformylglycinamidine synthase|nr:phosphoribosylformylglycinamidine synthase subunit PurS [Atribacterota bacterium]MDD4896600.1 phosphoribosylformylglycinamidine synthase subunit PurS [Atribacterota bacterium]MDD5637465.1 phosphoribosylformylglycinamidine synthase subunit PurS [Atribacterota bacterium]